MKDFFGNDQKIIFCGINFCGLPKMSIREKIKAINNKIEQNKAQYNLDRKTTAFCGICFCVLGPNPQKIIPH